MVPLYMYLKIYKGEWNLIKWSEKPALDHVIIYMQLRMKEVFLATVVMTPKLILCTRDF
jgi:hypothetical protein